MAKGPVTTMQADSRELLRPHQPLPALIVDLRKDSRASVVSAGALSPAMKALYVEDKIDQVIDAWLADPSSKLLILTGSAGHGKSAAMARAKQQAEASRTRLEIRYDATHADRPTESYREALRTFLAPFAGGKSPAHKHLLAMNLGLALDFFTATPEDAERFGAVGAVFNAQFGLGLALKQDPHPNVRIVDLTERMELAFDEKSGRASVPFVQRLLGKFSPDQPGPVQDAIQVECSTCERRIQCPVLLNVHLLNRPEVREHLAHAIMAGALEKGLHLTPRNLLDVISRVVVPAALDPEILPDVSICSLRESTNPAIADPKNWGARLHMSTFALAFAPADANGGEDMAILRSLSFEDPARIRSEDWDKQILEWIADPSKLHRDLPAELANNLGQVSGEGLFLGAKGLPLAIRSRRWMQAPGHRSTLLDEFIALCMGNEAVATRWESKVAEALTRIAAQRFDDLSVKGTTRLALHLEGVSSSFKVLADMLPLHVSLRPTPTGISLSNAHFVALVQARPDAPPEQVVLDWHRFQLISKILDGYVPPARAGPHVAFMDEVARRLATSSNMSSKVTVFSRERSVAVQLSAKRVGRTFVISAEDYDAPA
jgi:DNA phosphorothioation-dependent restriction protein DptF